MAVILGKLLDLIQGNHENRTEVGGGHAIENLFITLIHGSTFQSRETGWPRGNPHVGASRIHRFLAPTTTVGLETIKVAPGVPPGSGRHLRSRSQIDKVPRTNDRL